LNSKETQPKRIEYSIDIKMGAYLDTPITDKNPENGANDMV